MPLEHLQTRCSSFVPYGQEIIANSFQADLVETLVSWHFRFGAGFALTYVEVLCLKRGPLGGKYQTTRCSEKLLA
jgi:hypothetical protein